MVYERFIELLKEGHRRALEAVELTGIGVRKIIREELTESFTVTFPEFDYLLDMEYDPVRDIIYICGALRSPPQRGVIYYSQDKGRTWSELYRATVDRPITAMKVTKSGFLVFLVFRTGIFMTTDLKEFPQVLAGDFMTFHIAEDDDGNLLAPLEDRSVTPTMLRFYRSTDEGRTWSLQSTYDNDHAHGIAFNPRWIDPWVVTVGDRVWQVISLNKDATVITVRHPAWLANFVTIGVLPYGGLSAAGLIFTQGDAVSHGFACAFSRDFTEWRRIADFPHDRRWAVSDAIPYEPVNMDGIIVVPCWESGEIRLTENLYDWKMLRGVDAAKRVAFDKEYVYILGRWSIVRLRKEQLLRQAVKPSTIPLYFQDPDGKEWRDKSIAANDETLPIVTLGYHYKTISFESDITGDLTILIDLVGDEDFESVLTRTITGGAPPTNFLVEYDCVQIKLKFSVAATVTARIVMGNRL